MSRFILGIGASAPNINADALVDGEIDKDVPFSPHEDGYKLLFFYNGDFSFVSFTELTELKNKQKEFEELNCKIYGISLDSVNIHYVWSKKPENQAGISGINFTIFSDATRRISATYGLVTPEGTCNNASIIINKTGNIVWYNVSDPTIGRNINEIIRILQALNDKDKKVCPANWKRGDDTYTNSIAAFNEYLKDT